MNRTNSIATAINCQKIISMQFKTCMYRISNNNCEGALVFFRFWANIKNWCYISEKRIRALVISRIHRIYDSQQ